MGIKIMIGMPEPAVVVFRSVFLSMIDVYVCNMAGQIIHQLEPAPVAGQRELSCEAVYAIILVVVMGDKRLFTLGLVECFMVRKDISEVAPAKLVNYFSFSKEVGFAFKALGNKLV